MSLLSQFYPSGDTSAFPSNAALVGHIMGGEPGIFVFNGATDQKKDTDSPWDSILNYKHVSNSTPLQPSTLLGGERAGDNAFMVCQGFQCPLTMRFGQESRAFNPNYNNPIKKFFGLMRVEPGTAQKPTVELEWSIKEVDTIGYSHVVAPHVRFTFAEELVDTTSSYITFCPAWGVGTVGNPEHLLIQNAKLSAASVNKILIDNALSYPTVFGITALLDLSGGTSAGLADLTSDGLAARNTLIANGVTVNLN